MPSPDRAIFVELGSQLAPEDAEHVRSRRCVGRLDVQSGPGNHVGAGHEGVADLRCVIEELEARAEGQ